MALVSFRPFDPLSGLLGLQRDLERLLQDPSMGLDLGPSARGVFPKVNIFRDREGGLVVIAEVPGVDAGSLDVSVEPQRLTIRGERAAEERNDASYHRRERGWGEFARSIQLPLDLEPTAATATAREGLLTVRVPKREEAKPRQITVSRG